MPGAYQAVLRQASQEALRSRQLKLSGERPSLMLYMILGMFALLKDMLDLALGVIPGVGIVMSFVTGMCFSITAFALLSIFDRSGKAGNMGATRQLVHRVIVFLGSALVGMMPVLGFLPETTLAVIVLYALAHRAWKKSMRQAARTNTVFKPGPAAFA